MKKAFQFIWNQTAFLSTIVLGLKYVYFKGNMVNRHWHRNETVKHCILYSIAYLMVLLCLIICFPLITAAADEKPWSAEVHLKRYVRSHTSYEFGNPYPPDQSPLSLLEFPMNVWWAGGEVRSRFPRFSMGVEIITNISKESDLSFKDSDWSDDTRTGVKDIYSEAQCRMEPSYMARADVDLKISDWLRLPAWLDLRPVAGVRWQFLSFVAHNGVQIYPAATEYTPPNPYPTDCIRFEQTYWQYFIGIKTAYDLERHIKLPRTKMLLQLDWAYVRGENRDHHLLRSGTRLTFEDTSGNGWHAALGLKTGLIKNLYAGVEVEYLLIKTNGSHRWVHDIVNVDENWDHGVKVWSEQISFMMSLEYRF